LGKKRRDIIVPAFMVVLGRFQIIVRLSHPFHDIVIHGLFYYTRVFKIIRPGETMIIERKDLRSGTVRVRTETLDDLWHLEKVVEEGDLLTARTLRKTTIKRGSEIREGDRIPLVLTISLEKMELHPDSHSLRLTGPVVAGPEDKVQIGSYHTISLGLMEALTIRKQIWKSYQLDRLKSATFKKSLLLVCVLDREDASFAVLKESGIEHLAEISANKVKDSDSLDDYHKEILSYLQSKQDAQAIVLAGPGFERENLLAFIKKADPRLASRISLDHTHSTGRAGVTELVKSSANRILRDTRIARESERVQEFLDELNKDGLATYGIHEVTSAIKLGAVQRLLVSEERLREFEPLMTQVEQSRGEVHIISSDHELGERFLHLGGIGAILRYKV
jgi:protein pelota